MPLLLQYLIKLSFSLAVVWLFYQLVLRRLTFYSWNRLFLLGYSILAFFIPCINVSPVIERNELSGNKLIQFIPPLGQNLETVDKHFAMDAWDWVFIVFATGCLILLIKLVIQHISFLRLRRSSKLLLHSPVKLYQIDKEIIPFSFGGSIFINTNQHSEIDLKEIIRHEFVHVKQKHSIDMVCAEWLCILNWYNPFAWLIRKSMRQNLEFIADNKVIENGIDRKQYQYLLLKVMGAPQYNIATNFNFTSLKKRIVMMNKMRTAKVHLVKFLFVLPLIAVMLLSFRDQVSRHVKTSLTTREPLVRDTIPARPATPTKPAFATNVASIVSVNNQVTVTLKDGTKEIYNLNKAEEKSLFEKKYGSLPEPPTPPEATANNDIIPPIPPDPPVAPALPENVAGIHINNNKVVIKLKSGKVETYDLNKPGEKQMFEKKYGDIAIPPKTPAAPATPVAPTAPAAARKVSTITVTEPDPVITSALITPVTVNTTVSSDIIDIRPSINGIPAVRKEEVIAEISSQTTAAELTLLKKQLFVRGYRLEIDNVNYNNGKVQFLEGTIGDFDSKSSFVADEFSRIIISKVTHKNGRTGFSIRILSSTIRL